jgi:replicative DNA helicase
MEKLEDTILRNLLFDEDYTRKTLPFFRDEYFTTFSDRLIFEEIRKYFDKYSQQPSIEALGIELNGRNDIAEEQLKSAMESLETIEKDYKDETVTTDMNWLMEKSEKFCQDKALYNAIINSIAIFDENKTTKETKDAIPSILADALGVSFDVHIGHDYIDNADERFQFYRKKEEKIPFDLEYFNKITAGGLPRKTLNVALAGTGVGKSLFMCHMAASCLSENKNVLYITLEMAEERIAERIDANLMNVTMDTLKEMPKTSYEKKIGKLREKTKGKLIIKEYPTATASVNNFRSLLNELKIKRGFVPDILFMDYLNLCVSSRYRNNISAGSYFVVKAIAEELRGLAVEEDIPIVSATQLNRTGFMSSDVGLEDTSESFGLPATADFMFALISTEELEKHNQIKVKQLKNRYNDPVKNRNFVVGIDRAKMKLYDVEEDAQKELNTDPQEKPVSKSDGAMSWDKFQKEKTKKSGLERINMS